MLHKCQNRRKSSKAEPLLGNFISWLRFQLPLCHYREQQQDWGLQEPGGPEHQRMLRGVIPAVPGPGGMGGRVDLKDEWSE